MIQSRNQIVDTARSTPDDTPDQTAQPEVLFDERLRRINEAAYRRAEARGFEPGAEVDDWLSAERDIDASDTSDRGLPP